MTHELKSIIHAFIDAQSKGIQTVLATVVDLDGSSYRKPGVRMLLKENGEMIGAVSGGCVEKEVYQQALSVFKTGNSKMMTYDGRYRLGCEGVLYILLEPFHLEKKGLSIFQEYIQKRTVFNIVSYYDRNEGEISGVGSHFNFDTEQVFIGSNHLIDNRHLLHFEQTMQPCFQLIIIGAEHDAVQLCALAAFNGWEVTVISSIKDAKTIEDFPHAKRVIPMESHELNTLAIDSETAVVVMTHNFAKDLNYLNQLSSKSLKYVGLLGPVKRREQIIDQLLIQNPNLELSFLDALHGPAGLNIGAETPQEIATSIIAEILAVIRATTPKSLSSLNSKIHKQVEQTSSF